MRKLFIPVTLTASLLLSPVAFAAQSATGAGTTSTAPAKTPNPKRVACRDSWNAQTTHTGTKKDFMHACMAKS